MRQQSCAKFPDMVKQARKSSEDAQAAGYTQFEKSLGWVTFGSKKFGPKILAHLQLLENKLSENTLSENTL